MLKIDKLEAWMGRQKRRHQVKYLYGKKKEKITQTVSEFEYNLATHMSLARLSTVVREQRLVCASSAHRYLGTRRRFVGWPNLANSLGNLCACVWPVLRRKSTLAMRRLISGSNSGGLTH